ncbi:ribonucleotide reductase alpha subunit [Bradyrhizobium elkanii]
MRIDRLFTAGVNSPYDKIKFKRATSEIKNPDGSIVFRMENIEVPEHWSQVAIDVLAQKYFRKAGVPNHLEPVYEEGVPMWLSRRIPNRAYSSPDAAENELTFGSETSAKQVFDRLAGCWTYWGWQNGYFAPEGTKKGDAFKLRDAEANALAFFDELRFMLAQQMFAPNSPQWFNTGLHWAYGIDGPAQGHWYVADRDVGNGKNYMEFRSKSAYERPQPHACFIQSIEDDLVGDGGIMDLWTREAPPVQVRLRHGLQLLEPAWQGREAVRWRPVVRHDVLPQDR